jgi:hypothetical protein
MSALPELLGAFPTLGPITYLDLSEAAIQAAIEAGPYPTERTWFHATYSDRLPLIARTGLIPSCWWGGDSCAIFGVDQPRDVSLVRRADPLIEVRSRALDYSVKAWWVPPSAIQGVLLGSERRSLSPERDAGSLVWSHEPDGCGCELREIVREQQQLWRQRWA